MKTSQHLNLTVHSGSQFKPRKGFEGVKDLHQDKLFKKSNAYAREAKSRPDYGTQLKKSQLMNRYVKLPIFILTISCLSFLFFGLFDLDSLSLSAKEGVSTVENILNEKDRQAYKFLSDQGWKYLNFNHLDEAQAEFTRALEVDAYGMSARLGLIKVLELKCKNTQKYCDDIKIQREFAAKMNFLPNEINT